MIDDFVKEQPIAVKIMTKLTKKNNLRHAYIIEKNNYIKSDELIYEFVKAILCKDYFKNHHDHNTCNICSNVETGFNEDFITVEAETNQIKKQQLTKLQNEINTKSLKGNKRVYLIKDANKMNQSSANSILKFLEEPEPNIVAILTTNNVSNLLATITSRCQIISLRPTVVKKEFKTEEEKMLYNIGSKIKSTTKDVEEFINDEKSKIVIDKVYNFLTYYEKYKLETILHTESLLNLSSIDAEELKIIVNLMELFYLDLINILIDREIEFFTVYKDDLTNIRLNKNHLIKQLNILKNLENNLSNSINKNLLIDKIIIEFNEVNNDQSSRS